MNLQGFYTNKGRALAAKIAGGTAALTVTRVDAGSGHTADIPSATVLPDTEQTLTVGTASVSGSTATLPVTLSEAQAAASYSLTELGVYATDPDEGEILFQVYQLDAAAAVTGGGEGTLRFYLRQSIGAQGVTVVCSGAGTLVEEDIAPLRARVMAAEVPSRTVSVTLSGLQAYLDSLPRLLNENLTINVSGSYTGDVTVNSFFGGGGLTVNASGATLTGCLIVAYCAVFVAVTGLNIKVSGGTKRGVYAVENGGDTYVYGCSINGQSVSGGKGVHADGARIFVGDTPIRNCAIAVQSSGTAHVVLGNEESQTYSGNTVGCNVYQGGCIIQGQKVPVLLGGSSNSKSGGFIVKTDGSLA